MGKQYERISDRLREFIAGQPMFFVATAPLRGGHVNLSPKGYADTFAVIDDRTVGYLDLHGSGSETIAHLRENGRITVMFCSFDRSPKILRLYGAGRVVVPGTADWAELAPLFDADPTGASSARHAGARSMIVVDVHRIADSCGYAVPQLDLVGERTMLDDSHGRRTARQWAERSGRNAVSIDGLPALDPGHPDPLVR